VLMDVVPTPALVELQSGSRCLSSVDVCTSTHEQGDSQCAPNTRRPPRSRFARYPLNTGSDENE
jgi:hypothetical protein